MKCKPPLFVPFNIRNKIINENCAQNRDIAKIQYKDQYQTLLSYMKEKQILQGITKRQFQALKSTKNTSTFANYDEYRKGKTTQQTLLTLKQKLFNHHRGLFTYAAPTTFSHPNRASAVTIDDTNLMAYYKFNEASGNIINQSLDAAKVANSDLVITGATYSATGKIGNALSFDGVDDEGIASSSLAADWKDLHDSDNDKSYAMWVKFDNFSAQYFLVGTRTGNVGGEHGFEILMAGSTRAVHWLQTSGFDYTTTITFPNDANWHFLCLTLNITTPQSTASIDGGTRETGSRDSTDASNPTHVLRIAEANDGTYDLPGDLDEMSLWKRQLTQQEETDLYNGGAGLEIY